MVGLALDGRVGQDLGGLLEGSGGHERLGGQGRFGDTEEDRLIGDERDRLAGVDPGLELLVLAVDVAPLHDRTGQQLGGTGVFDPDLLHHLADDDLDVLIVGINALQTVGLLDLADEVILDRLLALDGEDVVGVDGAFGQRFAEGDFLAFDNLDLEAVGDVVALFALFAGDDDDGLALFLGEMDGTGNLRDDRAVFGFAALKQLDDTGKTLGDIFRVGDAAGVEGPHGQLGTGLADRLGGDDADRLTDRNCLAVGKVGAVALGADALGRMAGEDRTDFDGGGAGGDDLLGVLLVHDLVLGDKHLAGGGVDEIVDQVTALEALLEGLDHFLAFPDVADFQAVGGAAVLLADDDVLGDVDQTAGQVTRVGGPQRGIGQAFTGASGGDEVFEDGQAFAVVGLDRQLDGGAGGVRNQAAHTGQLADLGLRTTGARVGHHEDWVELVHRGGLGLGDGVGGVVPDADNPVLPLRFGEQAALVLAVDLEGRLFGVGD